MIFQWDKIQRLPDGRILLLYRHQRIFDEGWVRSGIDMMDIGGWGVLTQAAIEAGARCTILDLFTQDQYYPDRVRALPFVEGDARDQKHFNPSSFDTITCFEMLEHCGDADAVLENAYAWLRPNGIIAGTIPVPGFCHDENQSDIEFFSETEIARRLERAGFVIVRVEPTASRSVGEPLCCIYFVGRKPQNELLIRRHHNEPDNDFLKRFIEYQAGRDHKQEWCDYVASTAVRLTNSAGATIYERPLAELPNFPREIPATLEWCGKQYRVNAVIPRGIIDGATHAFKNEIIGDEITNADPLRDYEFEELYKLPE